MRYITQTYERGIRTVLGEGAVFRWKSTGSITYLPLTFDWAAAPRGMKSARVADLERQENLPIAMHAIDT